MTPTVRRNTAALLLALMLAGCSGSKDIIRRQQEEIAGLRIQNEELRARLSGSGDAVPRPEKPGPCGDSPCIGETISVLLTDLYFESGSATLSSDGVKRLAEVAKTIRTSYPNRKIRVEGHTDANPIGASLKEIYPSNWELSAARAAAVVRHFQWTHNMDPGRFEVVAFGPYAPVASNSTESGRSENRRVRIAVLPN